MKRYNGETKVRAGYYWCYTTGKMAAIGHEGGMLPGSRRYIRVPTLLFLACAPFVGLIYLTFLPLMGICFAGYFVAQHLGRGLVRMADWVIMQGHDLAHSLASVLTNSHVPGYAYLAKKRVVSEDESINPNDPTPFDGVEKEIAEKRGR